MSKKSERTPTIGQTVGVNVTVDKTREVTLAGGCFIVVNETTGAEYFQDGEGKRTEIHPPRIEPPPPEKPKDIPGKMVTGEDGVRRFVPDHEEDGTPIDLTPSLEKRDAEAKLTELQRRVRAIEEKRQRELKEIEALATSEDKIDGLMQLVTQLQKERDMLAQLNARMEVGVLAQALLLAKAQVPNQ